MMLLPSIDLKKKSFFLIFHQLIAPLGREEKRCEISMTRPELKAFSLISFTLLSTRHISWISDEYKSNVCVADADHYTRKAREEDCIENILFLSVCVCIYISHPSQRNIHRTRLDRRVYPPTYRKKKSRAGSLGLYSIAAHVISARSLE